MDKFDWVVHAILILFGNDLTVWVLSFILVLMIINMILGVFNVNNK